MFVQYPWPAYKRCAARLLMMLKNILFCVSSVYDEKSSHVECAKGLWNRFNRCLQEEDVDCFKTLKNNWSLAEH